jgi:hypothetical protein
MVVGVQAFDTLAVHGGGKPVLPLDTLLNGIASHPSLPEYWWLYALLLSSMIPSLVNLVIGGTSLLRGLPGLPSLLLRKIPTQGNVPKFDRAWIATVLTAQVAAGTALGIAAQATLVVLIRLRHAVLRPGIARHGPRRGRLGPASAGGAALWGQLIEPRSRERPCLLTSGGSSYVVKRGMALSSRPRPLAPMLRPQFGLAFVRPDLLAGFGGLLHLGLRSGRHRAFSNGRCCQRPCPRHLIETTARLFAPAPEPATRLGTTKVFAITIGSGQRNEEAPRGVLRTAQTNR